MCVSYIVGNYLVGYEGRYIIICIMVKDGKIKEIVKLSFGFRIVKFINLIMVFMIYYYFFSSFIFLFIFIIGIFIKSIFIL